MISHDTVLLSVPQAPYTPDCMTGKTEAYYAKTLPEGQTAWGFSVQELNPEHRIPKTFNEVFANKDDSHAAAANLVRSGAVQYAQPADTLCDHVYVNVTVRELQAFGCSDRLARQFFFTRDEIDNPALQQLIAQRQTEALHDAATRKVQGALDNAYEYFDAKYIEPADEKITQIFTVSNGRGSSFNILNFSATMLQGRSLAEMLNAIREMDQLTGGKSSEFTTYALAPNQHRVASRRIAAFCSYQLTPVLRLCFSRPMNAT